MSTGKVTGKRARRRWQDNIKMDLKETVSILGIRLFRLWIEIILEPF